MSHLQRIVDEIDTQLPTPAAVRENGSLMLMVGLPGTGKSSIVRGLKAYFPYVVVSTDDVRTKMRNQPAYTPTEMLLIYEVCYALIERRLNQRQRVVFDASNYQEARRDFVSNLARECGAPVGTCYVQASQETIQQRLARRVRRKRPTGDLSDADLTVYKWMVEAQEPIVGDHLILDTTSIPTAELSRRLYRYWIRIEDNAANDPNLQSPGWPS